MLFLCKDFIQHHFYYTVLGFDPDELPNSIAIDFDVNYDVTNYDASEKTPFQIATVASITKILNSRITVTIKGPVDFYRSDLFCIFQTYNATYKISDSFQTSDG